MSRERRAAQPPRHQLGQAALLARAPEVRRQHEVSSISGGSALTDDVHKAFHALGFTLNEGYGLTEAAPVLTVTNAGNKRLPELGGQGAPGVELRIRQPRQRRHRRGHRQGPERDGRLLPRPRVRPTRCSRTAGCSHGRPRPPRRAATSRSWAARRTSSSMPTGRTCTPTSSKTSTARTRTSRSSRSSACPTSTAVRRSPVCACPTTKSGPRDEVKKPSSKSTFAASRADEPFFRRIKVLRLWDSELPRTSTRKVKRPVVVKEFVRLEKLVHSADKAKAWASPTRAPDWLVQVIADVIQKPVADIRNDSRLQVDLGLDSLDADGARRPRSRPRVCPPRPSPTSPRFRPSTTCARWCCHGRPPGH
jgi:long-chain acyl-CoA synthetase